MNIKADPVLRTLAALEKGARGCITGKLESPAKPAQFVAMPESVSPALRAALAQRGVTQLYAHQADAIAAVQRREDVVVVTPTASGKTLCYNVPVVESVRAERAKALYLFPTKALSQDQVAELLELNRAGDLGVWVYTFDGDTPGDV